EPAEHAEAEVRDDSDAGADFEEDAAFGQSSGREVELAADEQVDAQAERSTAHADAYAATGVHVDGGVTQVDREAVEAVDAEREAAGTDVVVAGVDAHREVGSDVLDAEVKRSSRVTGAHACPIGGLRGCHTCTEGDHSDQGNQQLAHANPPNRSEKTWTFSSPAEVISRCKNGHK